MIVSVMPIGGRSGAVPSSNPHFPAEDLADGEKLDDPAMGLLRGAQPREHNFFAAAFRLPFS